MSTVTTGNAYGIGIITIIVGLTVGMAYYQMFYLPESFSRPQVEEHILEPVKETIIEMITGSGNPDQQDNFVPKLVNIQLGIENFVVWNNIDSTPHTVTPDHSVKDTYSGQFGSTGVIMPGESYEFLFTEEHEISYHCEPHPWMTGKLIITEQRF